jgi:YD repeat-containing protein
MPCEWSRPASTARFDAYKPFSDLGVKDVHRSVIQTASPNPQNTTSYTCDPNGNRTNLTDANSHTTVNGFDVLNQLKQETITMKDVEMGKKITLEDYAQLDSRIRGWPWPERVAISAAAAQRLLNHSQGLPLTDRDRLAAGLDVHLTKLWNTLLSGNSTVDPMLKKLYVKLRSKLTDYDTETDQQPADDDNASAAVAYALREYCYRDGRYPSAAPGRLIDAAAQLVQTAAEIAGEDLMSDNVRARKNLFARREFDRVLAMANIIELQGITAKSIERLQRLCASGALGTPWRGARGAKS